MDTKSALLFADAMAGVTYTFIRVFNCLHETGVVSRTQAISSIEGAIRGIHGQQELDTATKFLVDIVSGLRVLDQGGDFQPPSSKDVLRLL
jgi:hypothetical protein